MAKVDCYHFDTCDHKTQCPVCSCNIAATKTTELIESLKRDGVVVTRQSLDDRKKKWLSMLKK